LNDIDKVQADSQWPLSIVGECHIVGCAPLAERGGPLGGNDDTHKLGKTLCVGVNWARVI
jgi:hypothetical protein